jgi:hypothetical protein
MENDNRSPVSALNEVIRILSDLDEETRSRVVDTVTTFFHVERQHGNVRPRSEIYPNGRPNRPDFSAEHAPTPKEFLNEKQPRTDVERIACLAYYLTHYRNMPYFKTLDLAKLNTDAAQPKFSNTAYAATNAANLGYLASGGKGQRQLSAAGEQFVRALPDREAAKAAMTRARPKKNRKRR